MLLSNELNAPSPCTTIGQSQPLLCITPFSSLSKVKLNPKINALLKNYLGTAPVAESGAPLNSVIDVEESPRKSLTTTIGIAKQQHTQI